MSKASRIVAPSLSEATDIVQRIRSLDLEKVGYGSLLEELRPLVVGMRVKTPIFNPGLELFRGTRRFASTPPDSLDDFLPPPQSLSTLQRANRAGAPLFYCSVGFEPLFFELDAVVGTTLSIMKYRTTRPLKANHVGYTSTTFELLQSSRAVPDYFTLDAGGYSESADFIRDFLSEVFCQRVTDSETWRYKLSAATAELLLGKNPEPISGVFYPTIPMWGNAENLALRPVWARSHLKPVHAQFVKVTNLDPPNFSYDVLDEARRFSDGKIEWLGHKGIWELREQGEALLFTNVAGAYWEARDASGKIVDPV